MDIFTKTLQALHAFHSERSIVRERLEDIKRDIQNTIDQLQSRADSTTEQAKSNYWRCAKERLISTKREVERLLRPEELDGLTQEMLREMSESPRRHALARTSLFGLFASPSIRLLALQNSHTTWDLSLTNPFRHAWWLPVGAYEGAQDIWENTKDLGMTVAQVRTHADPSPMLEEMCNSAILGNRQAIFREAYQNYLEGRWTSAGVLLCLQAEGLLLDVGRTIDQTSISGHAIAIFDTNDGKRFIARSGTPTKFNSIRKVLLESQYGDALPLEYLEYFASDFYDNRCDLAHGKLTNPLTQNDVDVIIYALETTRLHLETLLNGTFPHNAPLSPN